MEDQTRLDLFMRDMRRLPSSFLACHHNHRVGRPSCLPSVDLGHSFASNIEHSSWLDLLGDSPFHL